MSNCQCGLYSPQMSAGKRLILKIAVHKKKYRSLKKSHWGSGMIDLWYLEWQKQEKHIELFPIHQWVNYILDSTFKLGEIKFIHIMLHYGLFTWKGICYYSFTDVLLQSQLTFITKFYLTCNVSRTLFLSLQYCLLFLEHN